jgi:hypothetical protein
MLLINCVILILQPDKVKNMLTEEKIKQVRKQLRSGEPQGEIKNQLVNEGFTAEEIDGIFKPHRPDMRSWYLVFAIIFFVVGFYNLVTGNSYLLLIFAAVMFAVYYAEHKRVKKSKS